MFEPRSYIEESTFETFRDGLFFFGLTENPSKKKAEDILQDHPGDKIRADIKKVNATYIETFKVLKKKVLVHELE